MKVEVTYSRVKINDLARLFAEVRKEHFPGGISNKPFIMSICSQTIKKNRKEEEF